MQTYSCSSGIYVGDYGLEILIDWAKAIGVASDKLSQELLDDLSKQQNRKRQLGARDLFWRVIQLVERLNYERFTGGWDGDEGHYYLFVYSEAECVEDVPEIAVGVMMLPGKNGEDDQFVIRLIGTGNSMKRAISHSGIADGEWDEWIANDSVQFAAVAAVE